MSRLLLISLCALACGAACAQPSAIENVLAGNFRWTASAPLVAAEDRDGDHYYSIKDPTAVRHQGNWHLFCTIRGKNRSHQIEYAAFPDWDKTDRARRVTLRITDSYFCAPQVFYFRPHKKWYLIYQAVDPSRKPGLQPAFSTTSDLTQPDSWTPPTLLFEKNPEIKAWIDFWVICDDMRAHLFFTSLDGKMWRSQTSLGDFPAGWDQPRVVLEGDIYEASHTYRLKGANKYLTVLEAQGNQGRRYYKAYVSDRLDGSWEPLAGERSKAFAEPGNVVFSRERWSDSFSHGELLRDSNDETLTVDPANLRFLFQGVSDDERSGKIYGEIPWRLGLLTPAR
jgi:hypothetical protein